jgi:hypothetical protein
MPHILITTDAADESREEVLLRERVTTSDLASGHFADQLIERVAWALVDAEETDAARWSERERGRRFPHRQGTLRSAADAARVELRRR